MISIVINASNINNKWFLRLIIILINLIEQVINNITSILCSLTSLIYHFEKVSTPIYQNDFSNVLSWIMKDLGPSTFIFKITLNQNNSIERIFQLYKYSMSWFAPGVGRRVLCNSRVFRIQYVLKTHIFLKFYE